MKATHNMAGHRGKQRDVILEQSLVLYKALGYARLEPRVSVHQKGRVGAWFALQALAAACVDLPAAPATAVVETWQLRYRSFPAGAIWFPEVVAVLAKCCGPAGTHLLVVSCRPSCLPAKNSGSKLRR